MTLDLSIVNTLLGLLLAAILTLVSFVYRRLERVERRVVRIETRLEAGGLGRAEIE